MDFWKLLGLSSSLTDLPGLKGGGRAFGSTRQYFVNIDKALSYVIERSK